MNWKKKLTTCTILVLLSTFIMFVINKIIYFVATLDNLLSKPEGHYYEWRFGNIFYTKQGDGKPILLIHDLNTMSSGYEWNKLVNHLAKTNTVYVIDLPGCGRSQKPNITYTNYLYVQMVTDFIKQIIGEKTDVISNGLSSSFILMACHNDDTIIDKIVMVSPHSFTSLNKMPGRNTKILKMLINTPIIGTFVYNILFSRKNITALYEKEYFYDSNKVSEYMTNLYYESAHTDNGAAKYLFSSIKGRYINTNITHGLKNLQNSIFIINGDERIEDINSAAVQYREYLPAIEIINIDKSLLVPHMEQPEEFFKQIKSRL